MRLLIRKRGRGGREGEGEGEVDVEVGREKPRGEDGLEKNRKKERKKNSLFTCPRVAYLICRWAFNKP